RSFPLWIRTQAPLGPKPSGPFLCILSSRNRCRCGRRVDCLERATTPTDLARGGVVWGRQEMATSVPGYARKDVLWHLNPVSPFCPDYRVETLRLWQTRITLWVRDPCPEGTAPLGTTGRRTSRQRRMRASQRRMQEEGQPQGVARKTSRKSSRPRRSEKIRTRPRKEGCRRESEAT